MPKFKYVAVDPKGKESTGVVEAADQAKVIAMMRATICRGPQDAPQYQFPQRDRCAE